MEILHLKKIFLITLIVSLIVSAIIGVVIFMLGNFGEVEQRILFTTGAITGFSLVGLFFSSLYEKKKFMPFSGAILVFLIFAFISAIMLIWEVDSKLIGTVYSIGSYSLMGLIFCWFLIKEKLQLFTGGSLILTLVAFLFRILIIWELISSQTYSKAVLIIFIIGFSILHISLLWLTKNKKLAVEISLFFTIAMVFIVALLLIGVVLFELDFNWSEFYIRSLGAFAILDGVGTVVTVILRKVTSLK